MRTFCIIPAWNEEKNIANVIDDLKKHLPENATIVVVDDNSSDKTNEIAKRQKIVVLKHIINRDQGAALSTGNKYALKHGADIVIHFDGDSQFLASDLLPALEIIKNNQADVIYGSRFLGKESNMPWLKKNILFPIARLVNFSILGIKMTDPQSGFRIMNKKALESIEITQRGKAHCSEILFKVFKSNLKVKEVPITVIYNHFGQNLSGGIRIVKDLLLAKFLN